MRKKLYAFIFKVKRLRIFCKSEGVFCYKAGKLLPLIFR